MTENEGQLKSLLMKGKEKSEKNWLKNQHTENQDHAIQPHHIMASRWGKSETVTDFIFLDSKITEDSD